MCLKKKLDVVGGVDLKLIVNRLAFVYSFNVHGEN